MRALVFSFLLLMCSNSLFGADVNGDGIEVILLPLAFAPSGDEVPGAYGTVWTGSVWMHNQNSVEVPLYSCPPAICPGFAPDQMGVVHNPLGRHPELGFLLHTTAEHARLLTFTSRIFERTRQGQPRGINIPVVREGEFFSGARTFLGVPASGAVRAGIRVYDPWVNEVSTIAAPRLTSVTVEVLNEQQVVLGSITLIPEILYLDRVFNRFISRPAYAAIHDLAAIVPQFNTLPFVHVRVRPVPADAQYYAMVAVTDNETQTVSIITAQ